MGKLWTDEETTPFATPWREAVIVPDKGSFKGRGDKGKYGRWMRSV